jgi:hypothetical protein
MSCTSSSTPPSSRRGDRCVCGVLSVSVCGGESWSGDGWLWFGLVWLKGWGRGDLSVSLSVDGMMCWGGGVLNQDRPCLPHITTIIKAPPDAVRENAAVGAHTLPLSHPLTHSHTPISTSPTDAARDAAVGAGPVHRALPRPPPRSAPRTPQVRRTESYVHK